MKVSGKSLHYFSHNVGLWEIEMEHRRKSAAEILTKHHHPTKSSPLPATATMVCRLQHGYYLMTLNDCYASHSREFFFCRISLTKSRAQMYCRIS